MVHQLVPRVEPGTARIAVRTVATLLDDPVVCLRAGAKVFGIYTEWDVANMKDERALWDGSDKQFIGGAMCKHRFSVFDELTIFPTIDRNSSQPACPQPTISCGVNVTHEEQFDRTESAELYRHEYSMASAVYKPSALGASLLFKGLVKFRNPALRGRVSVHGFRFPFAWVDPRLRSRCPGVQQLR